MTIKYKHSKPLLLNLCLFSLLLMGQTVKPKRPGVFTCSPHLCTGYYQGAEFNHQGDIAHQFSNTATDRVGQYLKQLYRSALYSKINFSKLKMTTQGMDGKGEVIYRLEIPLVRVQHPCDAFTSFDHVGGWGHIPELAKRKKELASALLTGDQLQISALMTTPEGLQEYWIQWRNNKVQAKCQGYF